MPHFHGRKKTESEYYYYLKQVARRINEIVSKFYDPANPYAVNALSVELEAYAATLTPWARQLARRMINRVNNYNYDDWRSVSSKLYNYFKRGYRDGDPAFTMATTLQDDEVNLIKSLPRDAAQRAQRMARDYLAKGLRPEALAEQILKTADIAKSRAQTIARTEIGKASTFLTKARAESIGARRFIWRTMEDQIVRPSHAALDGKIFLFDDPPEIEGEGRHLPADFPNCRCYAEPIIDERLNV